MIQWNKGQELLIHDIVDWYKYDKSEDFIYTGRAGTGKTTIIPEVIKQLKLEPNEVLFVAFTGKAASVLMKKGLNASTIHSAFYDVVEKPIKIDGEFVYKNGRLVKDLAFEEKRFIDPNIKLIVLDEWSMVDENLARVIYKHKVPILASGDMYQLEPIFGKSPFYKKVRYTLTEITRQDSNNGIIILANMILNGEDLPKYKNFYNNAYVLSKEWLSDHHMLDTDIILTAKNKTRNLFNSKVRALHGSTGKLPNVGDKLVCRKNNWSTSLNGIPLINGIVGKVVNPIRRDECNFARGIYRIDFMPDYVDGYDYYDSLPCDYNFLIEPCGQKEVNKYNKGNKLEYGEALTVHLSQGSEYNSVMYWDEWVGSEEYMRKLRYTAVTRAKNKLYMFI